MNFIFSVDRTPKTLQTIIVYAAFFLRAFSFLLLAPLLTRIIHPLTWGALLASQALGTWLVLILDFGFVLSLVRKISVNRANLDQVALDVENVLSAKILLLVPAALISWLATQVGILHLFPALAWWAFVWAVVQGFSPIWYFQATERLYKYALLEAFSRLIYLISAFFFIRVSGDAFLVLLLQAVTLLFTNVISLRWMRIEMGELKFSLTGGLQALREGIVLSGFTIITSIYTSASVLLFGFFAPALVVGVYGNADRLIKAGISLLGPMNQLLLPRSARAFAIGPVEGIKFFKRVLLFYSFLGITSLVIGWSIAPIAVELIFGKDYVETIVFLRLLLFLVPLISINTVIVYHYLIPTGRDVSLTIIYGWASVISLVLIIILVPVYGGQGMIIAMISPELFALISLCFLLFIDRQRRRNLV